MVPVRTGAGPDAAVAAVRRVAPTARRSTSSAPAARVRMTRTPGRRTGTRAPRAGGAAPRAVRERRPSRGTWPLRPAPRRTPHRGPGGAGGGRGTARRDLVDAARLREGGGRQQRHVDSRPAAGSEVTLHRGRAALRRHHQRAEPGGARADVDRQHRARRHADRHRVLRLPGVRRRHVPGAHRAHARAAIRCSTSR